MGGMMRWLAVLAFVLSGGLGVAIFAMKYQAQDMEVELAGIEQAIRDDQQAIHVLRAEWSLLNEPRRLQLLATRYLALVPVPPEAVIAPRGLSLRLGRRLVPQPALEARP